MSNLMPVAMEGNVVPGVKDPYTVFGYSTDRPHGAQVKETAPAPSPEQKPKDLGNERHMQLLDAIKGLTVKQDVRQEANINEALPENRDWR